MITSTDIHGVSPTKFVKKEATSQGWKKIYGMQFPTGGSLEKGFFPKKSSKELIRNNIQQLHKGTGQPVINQKRCVSMIDAFFKTPSAVTHFLLFFKSNVPVLKTSSCLVQAHTNFFLPISFSLKKSGSESVSTISLSVFTNAIFILFLSLMFMIAYISDTLIPTRPAIHTFVLLKS